MLFLATNFAASVVLGVGRGWTQEPAAPLQAQALHVLVGKSLVINLEQRLRRVLVSNPQAIEAVTVSPTQVVVTGKAPGASSLILWDETGQSQMLDVFVDQDVSSLRDGVQLAYPDEPIEVQAEGDRVVLSGAVSSQQVMDNIVNMANVVSKTTINSMTLAAPPHERQILLEVKFAEVDRTKVDQLGVNIISTGALNTPGTISTQQFGAPTGTAGQTQITGTIPGELAGTESTFTVSDILNVFLFRPDLNLATTIRALQQRNVLQILAEPNLLALNGRSATFLAGGEFPFPVVQGGTNFTAVTIQFRPFGVRLDFTGFITPENTIRLQVSPEVSTLDYTNALTISGFLIPAVSTRRAETEVELKDGQSFGIAGLIDRRVQAQMSKIPGLGDIPIIGRLFRSRSTNRSKTELMVLVTPHIVDPATTGAVEVAVPEPPIPHLDEPGFDRGLPGRKGAEETPPRKGRAEVPEGVPPQ